MRLLRSVRIKSSGTTVARNWIAGDQGRLAGALETVTHIVIAYDGTDVPDWVIYIYGYGAGKGIPIVISADAPLPPALGGAEPVSLSGIDNYMLSERSKWEQEHRVRIARTRLAGREKDTNAFYAAASEGDSRAIDDFLVAGQSPNGRSSEGVPILIGTVRSQSVECVQKLIAAGADPNASCGTDGTNALCEAASRGLATVTGVLLAYNADPNQTTSSGQSPLMLAASQGHEDVVERLLSAGADPSLRDSLGMDAAGYARLFGRSRILDVLPPEEPS
jgi:hypothetical protein